MRFQRKLDSSLRTKLRENARGLRAQLTPAEAKLWVRLKNRGLAGLRFRRQHRINSYIVDFFCPEAGLVVELDGPSHGEEAQESKDQARDTALRDRGLQVARFGNQQVHDNIDGVLHEIARLCRVEL